MDFGSKIPPEVSKKMSKGKEEETSPVSRLEDLECYPMKMTSSLFSKVKQKANELLVSRQNTSSSRCRRAIE